MFRLYSPDLMQGSHPEIMPLPLCKNFAQYRADLPEAAFTWIIAMSLAACDELDFGHL
jgi:hypothetical protein